MYSENHFHRFEIVHSVLEQPALPSFQSWERKWLGDQVAENMSKYLHLQMKQWKLFKEQTLEMRFLFYSLEFSHLCSLFHICFFSRYAEGAGIPNII